MFDNQRKQTKRLETKANRKGGNEKTYQRVTKMFGTKGNNILHVMLEMKGLRSRGLTWFEAGTWVLDFELLPLNTLDSKEGRKLFEGQWNLDEIKDVIFLCFWIQRKRMMNC